MIIVASLELVGATESTCVSATSGGTGGEGMVASSIGSTSFGSTATLLCIVGNASGCSDGGTGGDVAALEHPWTGPSWAVGIVADLDLIEGKVITAPSAGPDDKDGSGLSANSNGGERVVSAGCHNGSSVNTNPISDRELSEFGSAEDPGSVTSDMLNRTE